MLRCWRTAELRDAVCGCVRGKIASGVVKVVRGGFGI